jgi:5-methyltetrahydrofolate--homocysteine methyltransferase
MSAILNEISIALQNGDVKAVRELTTKALDDGVQAQDILSQGLLAGMDVISVRFKSDERFIPDVLIAARAMNAGTELLKPHLAEEGAKSIGKVVIGTVKGDLHDIGKSLVRMMLEGKGFEVVDIGVDAAAEKFVEAVRAEQANMVALSALLTTTMNEMKNVVDALLEAGLRDSVTIMVGGAPIDETFCKSIGADLYAPDAATSADVAKQAMLTEKSA